MSTTATTNCNLPANGISDDHKTTIRGITVLPTDSPIHSHNHIISNLSSIPTTSSSTTTTTSDENDIDDVINPDALPPIHTSESYQCITPTGQSTHLKRVLGWPQLLMLGIGATIGAGIFVVTGVVAATQTGPALFLSYILAACVCILSALCYSEMSSIVPSAGSAYSYVEYTIGQPYAFLVGWDLGLEYCLQTALVTKGFSQHFNQLFTLIFHTSLPIYIRDSPFHFDSTTDTYHSTGAFFDLPAFIIALTITTLIVFGVKKSAQFNAIVVCIKISAVLFVIFCGIPYIDGDNYTPFAPYGFIHFNSFTDSINSNPIGVVAGSAVVFYAFLGFDSVACQAEDAKNPKKDIPIAICLSVAISTLLYVAVSLVLVGMVKYTSIDLEAPVSNAFAQHGLLWAEFIIALGACIGMTAVILSFMLAQPRVLLSMSRDGYLPRRIYAVLHPKYATPYRSSIVNGLMVAIIASVLPYQLLIKLVNIGTIMGFLSVCVCVIILHYTKPTLTRPFKCPLSPFLPVCGILANLLLLIQLDSLAWWRWLIWFTVGLLLYFSFGRRNARKLHPKRYNILKESQRAINGRIMNDLSIIPSVVENENDVNEYSLELTAPREYKKHKDSNSMLNDDVTDENDVENGNMHVHVRDDNDAPSDTTISDSTSNTPATTSTINLTHKSKGKNENQKPTFFLSSSSSHSNKKNDDKIRLMNPYMKASDDD